MKKYLAIFTLIYVSLIHPVHANHGNPVEPNTILVEINGLVCDFCARALEKVFGKHESVSNIHVNLDSKIVTITFKHNHLAMNDQTIKELINDAGYDVKEIHRHD
tara:strand:+ start:363 stop:677 length:315 start_codon:yes stop_codon:yes gene_type:complete